MNVQGIGGFRLSRDVFENGVGLRVVAGARKAGSEDIDARPRLDKSRNGNNVVHPDGDGAHTLGNHRRQT
jgi:hypothetical protein